MGHISNKLAFVPANLIMETPTYFPFLFSSIATAVQPMIIIGHRGHPALMPEHSEPGYVSAINAGADFIECDVHFTRDLVAVCSHDPWLDHLTDVGCRLDLAHLRRTPSWEEAEALSLGSKDELNPKWWLWDLTWEQARELRLEGARDSTLDGQFGLVTLERFISIVEESDHKVGIYPELKSALAGNLVISSRSQNTTVEQLLINILHRHGYNGLDEKKSCLIQSFEIASLVRLHHLTKLPLVFLVESDLQLTNISCYSSILHGVGVWKQQVVEVDLTTRKLKDEKNLISGIKGEKNLAIKTWWRVCKGWASRCMSTHSGTMTPNTWHLTLSRIRTWSLLLLTNLVWMASSLTIHPQQ